MSEAERDLLERCRVLESRLGTLGAYAHIVKTLGPFVRLNDQHQFVIIEDAAAELARLRNIEAAARRVYDWVHNDPSSQAVRLRRSLRSPREPLVLLLYDLRKSLEHETNG